MKEKGKNSKKFLVCDVLNQIGIPLIFLKFYRNRNFFCFKEKVKHTYWLLFMMSVGSFFVLNGLVILGKEDFVEYTKPMVEDVRGVLRYFLPLI